MGHNIRCEMAKSPPEKCRCECNGKYHGIHARPLPSRARFVDKKMGGTLGKTIQVLNRKQLVMACGIQMKMVIFIGVPDESGVADRTGKKWAVRTKCRYLVDGKCTHPDVTSESTAECEPTIVVPDPSGIMNIDHLSIVELNIICFLFARKVWESTGRDEPMVIPAV
ncbi:MAG: hypothetical protein HXS41_06340 [Theionarchaea archaeon]|nr:hypothetical protein [Theionarchaea archaeon]MBU6999652.1 hypothetical protein [Theionarchaea archaeon]MBU7020658.1 hypothetical protein [Theionarchaea archaeon]MBU7035036.1 hypothetical protein [Theionarchaea archaeon]MBU7039832.1 hypothetical protein [Theionarchaea archaeon]